MIVCESLIQFRLMENIEHAKNIFANDPSIGKDYDKFFSLVKDRPNHAGKFAEWFQKREATIQELEDLLNREKQIGVNLGGVMDQSFVSLKKYREIINTLEKKDETEPPKLVKTEITDPKTGLSIYQQRLEKPKQLEIGEGFAKDLWVYGVLITTPDAKYVKFGDHRAENEQKAKEYAARETIGKLRGLVKEISQEEEEEFEQTGKDIGPFRILFVKKITDYAKSINPKYVEPNPKGGFMMMGFDNEIRERMPGKWLKDAKSLGGESLEIHEHNKNENWQEIKAKWEKALNDLITGKDTSEKKEYKARQFHEEMNIKISSENSDKHLLGAATGSGKEVITLATLIFINDQKKELFNTNTIHVSCATIPATELELFEELSRVSGMVIHGKTVNFSRIVPYCTSRFARSYINGLTPKALKWFNENVNVIDSTKNIPQHSQNQVPVLFGSFQDIGLKAGKDPKGHYAQLGDRIGILSIGEGHQFLSNASNKEWTAIKEKYKFKFLLLITGTPYDFIFNEAGHLYFSPNERTLFTRNDLYEAKRNGDKDFEKYPTFNYYDLDLEKEIQKIKEDEGENWKDEEGFTYEKLFEKSGKKFKYEELIIFLFKRLFSFNQKGRPDQLSILEAKDLCDEAKKHILIALPTGTKDSPAGEYITDLKNLLEKSKALGNYILIASYEDDLGDIKEKIKEEAKTVTLTCRKLLTGTNIPKWGSLVFLRPMGSSIKFFEQATGRIGRPSKNKTNVGVFLGNIDNVASFHVSADEKVLNDKEESKEYNYIIKRTYDNYNFFGVKDGKWQKLDMPDLIEAVERASMSLDYNVNLCLNNPKAPDNFDLVFKAPSESSSERVEITSQGNEGAKHSYSIDRTTQLALEFEEANNKDKWYRDMIKTHIPKIVMICLLKNISTIQEFEKVLNKALKENDEEFLNLIGKGVGMIPVYIGDDNQIDRAFLNRWIDKNNRLTSNESGFKGFEKRYEVINERMDIKKLSESIVFDPIELTEEMCEKIKDPLKKANRIMVIEKNGSFTYSILKIIGENNVNKLTLIALEPLSKEIMNYLFLNTKKLPDIKYIKNIDKIKSMPKFDVVVGNPPYQSSTKESNRANALWPIFLDLFFKMTKENGYVGIFIPSTWMNSSPNEKVRGRLTVSQVRSAILKNKNIKYINNKSYIRNLFDVGVEVGYLIAQNNKKIEKTKYETDEGEMNLYLNEMILIPKNINSTIYSILEKTIYNNNIEKIKSNPNPDPRFTSDLRHFEFMSTQKDEEHKYPSCNTSAQYDKGIYLWSSIPHPYQYDKKIIFSDSGYAKPFYDDGKFGLNSHSLAIFVNDEEEAKLIINYLNSDFVKFIEKIMPTSGFATGMAKFINYLPKVNSSNYYKELNLTKEEIDYIESHVK